MEESYISKTEQQKCERVAEAFRKMYQKDDILIMDAGRYGFVKLWYYRQPGGFDDVTTFTDSREMFEDLWEEWIQAEILTLTQGTPMSEMDYEDKFKCLPIEKQTELFNQRAVFAKMAGIEQ